MKNLATPPLALERRFDSSPSNGVLPSAATSSLPGRTLILGLGNEVRTDAAIGLVVARALRSRFASEPAVEVIESPETGLGLLDVVAGYHDLLVIDSVRTGRVPPGSWHEVGEDGIRTLPGKSPHFLGVAEILALGRLLGQTMPTRVQLFAVEIEDDLTLGTRLSATLERALPAIIGRIAGTVAAWAGKAVVHGRCHSERQ